MITDERKVHIMNLIRRDGFVSVRQLMNVLNVSRSSVMRDLDELEKQGLVIRQRGGASLVNTDSLLNQFNEPTTHDKYASKVKEKERICKAVALKIKDGDCIYIDSGTTVLPVMDYITHKEVNIVTPNIYLLSRIPQNFKGNIILLGGQFNRKYDAVSGVVTNAMLNDYYFDMALLTANGFDYDTKEVFAFNVEYAACKKKAMMRSRTSFLLVDASKKNITGLMSWAHMDMFESVYMDRYDRDEIPDNVCVCKE